MSLEEYLQSLKGFKGLSPDLVCHRTIPEKKARYADKIDCERADPDPVFRVFERQGIERLYRHQTEAVNLIEQGIHTVIATPTASGKSLL